MLVIHPGARWVRIGRASDVTPFSIPNVIARKHKPPVPPLKFVEGVSRPLPERERGHVSTVAQPGDEYSVATSSDDPVCVELDPPPLRTVTDRCLTLHVV